MKAHDGNAFEFHKDWEEKGWVLVPSIAAGMEIAACWNWKETP